MARAASAHRLLTLILLAAVAAGCASDDAQRVPNSSLPQLVLQPSDLTQGWVRFDEGPQLQADAPPGAEKRIV